MGHHAGLADRGEDARIAHQEGQDRLHLLWRRLQLRCLDQDRNILKIVQVHRNTNQISTCVKGKFGWDFVDHADHWQRPLIREGTGFRESEWDEALGLIATKLSGIKQQSGPDAIAVIISSKTTVDYSPLGSASNGGCGRKRLFEAGLWPGVEPGQRGDRWSLDPQHLVHQRRSSTLHPVALWKTLCERSKSTSPHSLPCPSLSRSVLNLVPWLVVPSR